VLGAIDGLQRHTFWIIFPQDARQATVKKIS